VLNNVGRTMAATATLTSFSVDAWRKPAWRTTTTGGAPKERFVDPDLQLVERCLAGEQSAWEDLVKTHSRRVYAICLRFTGSDHQAQDLAQEVFLRVFRSLKSFRTGEGVFSVWLGRLTRN